MGAERREHVRVPFVVAVSIRSESNFFTGFVRDISEGGLFIATSDVQEPGTEVSFELALLPGAVKAEVTGVVRWVRDPTEGTDEVPAGMGVEFLELHPRVRTWINRFIDERREPLFYDDSDD